MEENPVRRRGWWIAIGVAVALLVVMSVFVTGYIILLPAPLTEQEEAFVGVWKMTRPGSSTPETVMFLPNRVFSMQSPYMQALWEIEGNDLLIVDLRDMEDTTIQQVVTRLGFGRETDRIPILSFEKDEVRLANPSDPLVLTREEIGAADKAGTP